MRKSWRHTSSLAKRSTAPLAFLLTWTKDISISLERSLIHRIRKSPRSWTLSRRTPNTTKRVSFHQNALKKKTACFPNTIAKSLHLCPVHRTKTSCPREIQQKITITITNEASHASRARVRRGFPKRLAMDPRSPKRFSGRVILNKWKVVRMWVQASNMHIICLLLKDFKWGASRRTWAPIKVKIERKWSKLNANVPL